MKPKLVHIILTFAGTALGQKPGTATEAKQMVEDALAYINDVGPEKAFQDFARQVENNFGRGIGALFPTLVGYLAHYPGIRHLRVCRDRLPCHDLGCTSAA